MPTYMSSADEEGDDFTSFYSPTVKSLPEGSWVSVSVKVKSIDRREFTLDTGVSKIKIDTITLAYNPLDDGGVQQID